MNINDTTRARRIGGSLLWSQVGRFLDIGLGLLFSILVVRVLGPDDYAVYAVAWSIVNVAALVASLGYGELIPRFVPELAHAQGAVATLMRRLLIERFLIGLLLAGVVWAGVSPLALWTHTPPLAQVIALVGALAAVQGLWELLVAFYTATLRMRDQAGVRVLAQVTSVALAVLLFWRFGVHVWIPLVAQLASYLVSSVIYFAGARPALMAKGGPLALGAMRRFGGYVWLTNLATFGLASQIDVLLIAALLSDSTQVSYYNVAVLLSGRLYTLLMGWTAVLVPSAAESRAAEGTRGLARSFDLYMKLNLAVLVPPLLFVAGWSGPLITLFFGKAYGPAALPLQVFAAFGCVSALAGANICHPLLYVADRQRALLWLRIVAGALNVALDLLLIPPFGAVGAVLGTSISNLAAHLVELGMLRQMIGKSYPSAVALKLLLGGMLALLPSFWLPDFDWLTLVIGGLLFASIFFIAIRVLRPLSGEDYATLERVMPRVKPIVRWFTAG
ncbi:MAG: flippase [Anaerolineae bacterium]